MDVVSSSAGQILVLAFRKAARQSRLAESELLCLKTRTRVQLSQILPLTGASRLVLPVHSVHGGAVPAAPGAAGPHAETAAGAEPTAATSQQPGNNYQRTGQ